MRHDASPLKSFDFCSSQSQRTRYGLQVLVVDKTGPTSGDSWEERLSNINWSETENLESLWESLKDLATRET